MLSGTYRRKIRYSDTDPQVVSKRNLVALAGFAIVLAACTSGTETDGLPFTLPPGTLETTPSTTATTQAPTEDTSPATTSPPAVDSGDQGYLWQRGDCVQLGIDTTAQLPYAPYGTSLIRPCAEPHTHEVYLTSALDDPIGAPYPEQLSNDLWSICYTEFTEQLGFLASDSTLELVLYLPDEQEWAAGERYHACVVHQFASDDEYIETVGSITDDPESFRWSLPTGACLDTDALSIRTAEPVPCGTAHSFEMIGEVQHPDGASAPYPGEIVMLDFVQAACGEVLASQAAVPYDPLLLRTLTVPFVLAETEWDLGQRSLRCFAFVATIDGDLFDMRESVTDEGWEIIGPRGTDDGVTA